MFGAPGMLSIVISSHPGAQTEGPAGAGGCEPAPGFVVVRTCPASAGALAGTGPGTLCKQGENRSYAGHGRCECKGETARLPRCRGSPGHPQVVTRCAQEDHGAACWVVSSSLWQLSPAIRSGIFLQRRICDQRGDRFGDPFWGWAGLRGRCGGGAGAQEDPAGDTAASTAPSERRQDDRPHLPDRLRWPLRGRRGS